MWFDTILWLVAIVAFIAVETATTALVSVWFAIGAAAAMFASFFTSSLGIRHRNEHKPPVTNGSPLTIGKQGIVLVAIEPGMPGRVRVDGLDWQARAEVAIPQGARICVADVDGAVLLVTPVTEAMSVE